MAAYKYVLRFECSKIPTRFRNEIFGPVLSIVIAETLDEAIEIVNANR